MNDPQDVIKERLYNIAWTTAENYNFYYPTIFLPDYNDFSPQFYEAALIGYAHKRVHMDVFLAALQSYVDQIKNFDEIKIIFRLALEEMLIDGLLKERPGISDFYHSFIETKVRQYRENKPHKLNELLEYGYYFKKKGLLAMLPPRVEELLRRIEKFSNVTNTNDLLTKILGILDDFFELGNLKKNEDVLDRARSDLRDRPIVPQESKDSMNIVLKQMGELEKDVIESAEFARTHFSDELSEELSEPDEAKNLELFPNAVDDRQMKRLIESYYGKSILSDASTLKLEEELCVGIHNKVKFHITKGEFSDGLNDAFRQAQIRNQFDQNWKHFCENSNLYNRSIGKLKEIIRKTILQDLSEATILSDNGELLASKLWRMRYLYDRKIFTKSFRNDFGELSVDILLDQSASQIDRQSLVASQGYIISEALTGLNIPTRVMGFNNFYNYMIIKLYRNYTDPKAQNKNIFNFQASGCNRDGLAIRFVSHLMKKNQVDNKILIVLSDGKPNDKSRVRKIGNRSHATISDYAEEIAIEDTAQEVFRARLHHIALLGVFTGEENELEAVKTIYGVDFAHITDITRFSEIVGYYLKEVFLKEE